MLRDALFTVRRIFVLWHGPGAAQQPVQGHWIPEVIALYGGAVLPGAALVGFLGYGLSLSLFVVALRTLGTARTAICTDGLDALTLRAGQATLPMKNTRLSSRANFLRLAG